jgi:hypothetical protein
MACIQTIDARIQAMNDAQLKQLLGRLMLDLNPENEPVLDEADLQQRMSEGRKLLEGAVRQLNVNVRTDDMVADMVSAKQFLLAVAAVSSQHAAMIEAGLNEVEASGPKLDFGVSAFALNMLVMAIAGAVLRPRLKWTSEAGPNGVRKEFSFVIEGVDEIEKVIKAVFPFLR